MSFDYDMDEEFPSEKTRSLSEQVKEMSDAELFHQQLKEYEPKVHMAIVVEISKRAMEQRKRIEEKLDTIMKHLGIRRINE